MSYSELLENIKSVEKEIGASVPGFNLDDFLLSDKEIAKKLILTENPSVSEADANLMVDGFNIIGSKSETETEPQTPVNISEAENDLSEISSFGDTPFKKKLIDDSIKDQVDNQSMYPLTEDSPYYLKAKSLKLDMKQKVTEFVRKVTELVKEIALATITIGTSVPGGVGMLAPFAFNVPGMITMILDIIMLLLGLKSKALDALSIFPFFSSLFFLTSPKALDVVSSILSSLYKILKNSILSILLGVQDFINEAISSIKSNNTPKKEKNRSITIAKKLRDLKYLPNNNFKKVNNGDINEVKNILESWEVIKTGKYINIKKEIATLGEVKRKIDINKLIDELDNLDSVVTDVKEMTGVSEEDIEKSKEEDIEDTIVFDVELPNGEKIIGLSKEEVDGLKSTYNVIFSEKKNNS